MFRAEYECFQIELAKNYGVPEWREDLKKVLMKSGVENKSMVFLFSDTQVNLCNYSFTNTVQSKLTISLSNFLLVVRQVRRRTKIVNCGT